MEAEQSCEVVYLRVTFFDDLLSKFYIRILPSKWIELSGKVFMIEPSKWIELSGNNLDDCTVFDWSIILAHITK